jgi:hypothetical protein
MRALLNRFRVDKAVVGVGVADVSYHRKTNGLGVELSSFEQLDRISVGVVPLEHRSGTASARLFTDQALSVRWLIRAGVQLVQRATALAA